MSQRSSSIVSQIHDELKTRYLSPVVPGTRLPPERELLRHFDVSRPTLRRAIAQLVKEGLLKRYPGRGTFVLGPDAQDRFVQPGSAALGLICKSLLTSEGSHWVTGAVDRAFVAGLTTCVAVSNSDIFRELALLRQLLDHGVDGVLLHPALLTHASATLQKELARVRHGSNVPLVLLGKSDLFPGESSAWFDEEQAGYVATRHLIEAGHKRIAHVGCHGFDAHRLGYTRALKDAAIPIPAGYVLDITTVPHSNISLEVGRNAGKILLSMDPPPTAVFAYWTEVAAGVIVEATARNLRIPEQMAAIGVGQELSPAAQSIVPIPMSTIRTNMQLMGETAMELLLQAVGGGAGRRRQSVLVAFELDATASTTGQSFTKAFDPLPSPVSASSVPAAPG